MSQEKHVFLICTVGGNSEPIVAALKHWSPSRIHFVHTPETRKNIHEQILAMGQAHGVALDPGRYELLELRDGQNLAQCIDELRRLTPNVTGWVARGGSFQVVVDFTGGTKCMSAAIAIQASRWPCLFSYVGGTERTGDGVGVVVSGAEKIFRQDNPWDALGYQAVAEFVVLFNQHAFGAAREIAALAKKRVSSHDRKREFAALEQLAQAFDAWDRFNHHASHAALEGARKAGNDLRAALGHDKADSLLAQLERVASHLAGVCSAPPPSRHHALDLLANAWRRRHEERLDDAVARLYRAIEAMAQLALRERHGIASTDSVPLERIPMGLRTQWAAAASDGVLKLGLQDSYALLASLGDEIGARFQAAGLGGPTSPLVARNRSILAHGFERVPLSIFDQLWTAALSLADTDVAGLPPFPTL